MRQVLFRTLQPLCPEEGVQRSKLPEVIGVQEQRVINSSANNTVVLPVQLVFDPSVSKRLLHCAAVVCTTSAQQTPVNSHPHQRWVLIYCFHGSLPLILIFLWHQNVSGFAATDLSTAAQGLLVQKSLRVNNNRSTGAQCLRGPFSGPSGDPV